MVQLAGDMPAWNRTTPLLRATCASGALASSDAPAWWFKLILIPADWPAPSSDGLAARVRKEISKRLTRTGLRADLWLSVTTAEASGSGKRVLLAFGGVSSAEGDLDHIRPVIGSLAVRRTDGRMAVNLKPMQEIVPSILQAMKAHPLPEQRFGRRLYSETEGLRVKARDVYRRLPSDSPLQDDLIKN